MRGSYLQSSLKEKRSFGSFTSLLALMGSPPGGGGGCDNIKEGECLGVQPASWIFTRYIYNSGEGGEIYKEILIPGWDTCVLKLGFWKLNVSLP